MKLFGTHEWAARIPTVIAAASTLALTVIIADLLAIPTAALLAVLILGTSFRSWWLFQRVSLDVLMTAFVCTSIVGWLRHWRDRGSPGFNGLLFFGGIAWRLDERTTRDHRGARGSNRARVFDRKPPASSSTAASCCQDCLRSS